MKPTRYCNSLLYKISGNGLKKPSYLLGTMHMICAKDFEITKKINVALRKCATYFMEVDLGSADELNLMEQQQSERVDFTEGLSSKQKDALNDSMMEHFGVSLDNAGGIPPIALINKMTMEAMGCDEISVAEIELMHIARSEGLQTAGLETAQEQIAIAKKVFTGKEMLWQLNAADDYKNTFAQMVEAYHTENLQHLASLVTNPKMMSKRAYRILVVNRNKRWAKKIPKLISKSNAFIAVGAGHLPGETGLLHLLSEQGYAVNAVYR